MKDKYLSEIRKTININGKEIPFIYRLAKTKNSYIKVNRSKEIVVTVSKRTSPSRMGKFINDNIERFAKAIENKEEKQRIADDFTYLHILGKKYILNYHLATRNGYTMHQNHIDVQLTSKTNKKQLVLKILRDNAQKFALDRIKFWEDKTNIKANRIVFQWLTSKWGSCDKKTRIIKLAYQLLAFEADVIDYVIVHELCHIVEANHSKNFWNLVNMYMPNFKDHKKFLNYKK